MTRARIDRTGTSPRLHPQDTKRCSHNPRDRSSSGPRQDRDRWMRRCSSPLQPLSSQRRAVSVRRIHQRVIHTQTRRAHRGPLIWRSGMRGAAPQGTCEQCDQNEGSTRAWSWLPRGTSAVTEKKYHELFPPVSNSVRGFTSTLSNGVLPPRPHQLPRGRERDVCESHSRAPPAANLHPELPVSS